MTDAHDTEHTKSVPKEPNKKGASRSRRWVVVILALLVLGVAGQQVWTLRLWEGLNREEAAVVTVDSRLAMLESALANQQQVRHEIEMLRQMLQQERHLLQLDRLEERLDTGWQLWVATGDSKALVNALKEGQSTLASDPTSAAQALRLAMGRDQAEIQSQHMTDLRESVEQLDGVIASINQLPLVQDRRLPQAEPVPLESSMGAPADTLMEKARLVVAGLAEELWQSIRGMVRVQRLDRAEAALIAPDQRVFLQQGLRLLLLDARHALVQRNTATYQQTLSQARGWIEKYYDASNTLVKTDLSILQRLSGLNIEPSAVSLEATRAALAMARSAASGEQSPGIDSHALEATSQSETKAKGASE